VSTQSIRDFTYYNHSCKSFSRFYRNANTEISSTQQPDAILESIKLGVVPLEQKSLRLKARLDRVQQKTNTFIRQGARFGSFHFCYSETFEKALSTAPKALEEKKDGIKKMGSIKSWLGSLEK
jgi:hypothetical protein